MDRPAFRKLLADRAAEVPATVPMLERHAARLEQLAPGSAARDAEALARAMRAVHQLYRLTAVTVGDGGDALVDAARGGPGSADPAHVLSAPAFAVPLDCFGRLRTVLREHAAIVVVLPAAARLVNEADMTPGAASALLIEAIRAFGAHEPDAFILTGHDDEPDPAHDALGAFYGAPVLRIGTWTSPGIAVRPDLQAGPAEPERPYLIATPAEMRPELDPVEVRARLTAVAAPAAHGRRPARVS
jgi:hypothetical protein